MDEITFESFQSWLEEYGRASKENDPRASAELFTTDAAYYETPFAEPMRGREAIYQYWAAAVGKLQDKVSNYEILAVSANRGLARWKSEFVNVKTAKKVKLDCIFIVEFDGHQRCHVFQEWWHIFETEHTLPT